MSFDRAGFSVRMEGPGGSAGKLTPAGAFFAGVGPDTDMQVNAVPQGVESFLLLRSPVSPERFALDFTLPPGGHLIPAVAEHPIPNDPPRSIEIQKADGTPAGYVYPPSTTDADGNSVASSAHIEGSRVVLEISHHGRDLHYPLNVDPTISEYGNRNVGFPGIRWHQSVAPNDSYFGQATNVCPYYCGLYESLPTNSYFTNFDYAEYYYNTPPNAFVTAHTIYGWAHSPYYTYAYTGLLHAYRSSGDPSGWQNGAGGFTLQNQVGTIFPDNPYTSYGSFGQITATGCFVTRCDFSQGEDLGSPVIGLGVNNYSGGSGLFTGGNKASVTVDGVGTYLGDRHPPYLTSPQPASAATWVNDNGQTHQLTTTAHDDGLGLNAITLQGVSGGTVTNVPASWVATGPGYITGNNPCNGAPANSPCPNDATAQFAYTLPEGVDHLSLGASDIAANQAPQQQWTEMIDRTPPTGTIDALPAEVRQTVSVTGTTMDPNGSNGSGVATVAVQDLPPGGSEQTLCAATTPDPSGRFSCTWNTADGSHPDGTYQVRIVVTDKAGNQGITAAQTVVVANGGTGNMTNLDEVIDTTVPVDVNVATGNASLTFNDFDIANTSGDLSFTRTINTTSPLARDLGVGITDTAGYDVRLDFAADGSATLVDGTGYLEHFSVAAIGSLVSDDPDFGSVTLQGSSYVFADAGGGSLTFDTNGRLTRRDDPGGSSLTYDYVSIAGQSHLNSIHDPAGTTTNFQYDASGRITEIDAPGGQRYTYAYDASNRMTSFQDVAQGQTTGYAYGNNGLLAEVDSPAGHVVKLSYDSQNRVTAIETIGHGNGGGQTADATTTYSYGPPNGICDSTRDTGSTTVTGPDEQALQYCHGASGEVTDTSEQPTPTGPSADPMSVGCLTPDNDGFDSACADPYGGDASDDGGPSTLVDDNDQPASPAQPASAPVGTASTRTASTRTASSSGYGPTQRLHIRVPTDTSDPNHPVPGTWATIRAKYQSYVIGEAYGPTDRVSSRWLFDVRGPISGYAAGKIYGDYLNCGWVALANSMSQSVAGRRTSCGTQFRPPVTKFARKLNCHGLRDPSTNIVGVCTIPSGVPVDRQSPECGNVLLLPRGMTHGCHDHLVDRKTRAQRYVMPGSTVDWRYVTRDNKWVLVKNRSYSDPQGSWVFIRRAALPVNLCPRMVPEQDPHSGTLISKCVGPYPGPYPGPTS